MKIGDSNVDFKGLLIDGPAGCRSVEPKIMSLLHVLASNAGEVMTREDLITAVWGVEYGGDERLSRAISILRKALGDKRGQYTHIVTISRVGYRLIAQINQNVTVLAQPRLAEAPQHHSPEHHSYAAIASPATVEVLAPLSVTTKSMTTMVSKARALSLKGRAAITGLVMACVVIGFFVLTGGRTSETLSLQARMERGFSHIENFTPKGAIGEAQDIFSGILADDPSHGAARAGLAFAVFREYTHLERDPALLQRAKAHAEAALRADEHLALANIAVAWAAEFEGDFDRAHEHLDRADILDAGNIFALEGRYRTYGKQGQMDKAGEIINKAIAAYPERALFYRKRGDYFIRTGDFAASENDFRKAITLSPDSPRTYAQLAHSLHVQGRTEEAVSSIQAGLNVNETALLYSNLGTYLFFQGQYGLAASAFEKTLTLSGDTHDYLYWANLGDAYRWSEDKNEEAATPYRRALQLLHVDLDRYPGDNNLKSRAAMFNAKLGNLDQAQFYMDSFDLTSASPAIQLYRSVVTYEILSNRTKALIHLEAAIKSNYPMIEILNDPELALLRQDPDYHRLLAKTKNH